MRGSIAILNPSHRIGIVDVLRFQTQSRGATVVLHPRFQQWLKNRGLDSAPAILGLPGEIVGGHPDRNVAKVKLGDNRFGYLKREHVVGWAVRFKNWREGFGAISRSEREAITLQWLEETNLPAPQWLAYGTDGDGKAFLLIDELTGYFELPDVRLTRWLIERIAAAIAELHDSGIGTPDLSAKHVLIHGESGRVILIDWASAPSPGLVAWGDRARSLARFAVSICGLNTPLALRFLRMYLKYCRGETPDIRDLFRHIQFRIPQRKTRSTALEQTSKGESIRFVWQDDERLVTIPGVNWPNAWDSAKPTQKIEWTEFAPFGRLMAWFRGKPWRSRAAIVARRLAQMQKANLPAPRLLAYGQDLLAWGFAKSFVLTNEDTQLQNFSNRIRELGKLTKQAHESGMRLSFDPVQPLFVVGSTTQQLMTNAVHTWRRDPQSRVEGDLAIVVKRYLQSHSRTDRLRFLRAYERAGTPMRLPRKIVFELAWGVSR